MILFRRTSLLAVALGLFTLIYLVNHFRLFSSGKPPYIYGENDPKALYDPSLFHSGAAKPAGQNYTRMLVMGRLAKEDVSWLDKDLPDLPKTIYIVDAPDHSGLPANKGHEGMVYLTYIIDHYDSLPDVVLFFHPHKITWHNNILLDLSLSTTIKLLSDAHVMRQGYFNSRCHLDPGCRNWLHIDQSKWKYDHIHKPEEPFFTSKVFHDLFGADIPIPSSISQPCCAQFAVSGERIRQRPREDYIRYRSWLLSTPLEDTTSGRIMEYAWQYIFSGQFNFCPSQHKCYCDGYGICFEGGDEGLKAWLALLRQKEALDKKMVKVWEQGEAARTSEKYKLLQVQSAQFGTRLVDLREAAIRKGFDPKSRAQACGREWHEGDGF
ncbi:hypothetical protein H2200_004396 [Cladophialophora chaetospira]|uniref:Uncharacterized protein n=1 Tax=Cladophialophora chaetospira TaxID=386627 RepID=A0AA38XD25_9EURO|nr:hypothetical protein H2200_004396 [Cladophialophora chaetospira]